MDEVEEAALLRQDWKCLDFQRIPDMMSCPPCHCNFAVELGSFHDMASVVEADGKVAVVAAAMARTEGRASLGYALREVPVVADNHQVVLGVVVLVAVVLGGAATADADTDRKADSLYCCQGHIPVGIGTVVEASCEEERYTVARFPDSLSSFSWVPEVVRPRLRVNVIVKVFLDSALVPVAWQT